MRYRPVPNPRAVCLVVLAASVAGALRTPLAAAQDRPSLEDVTRRWELVQSLTSAWDRAASHEERTAALNAIMQAGPVGIEAAMRVLERARHMRPSGSDRMMFEVLALYGDDCLPLLLSGLSGSVVGPDVGLAAAFDALSEGALARFLDEAWRLGISGRVVAIGMLQTSPVAKEPIVDAFVLAQASETDQLLTGAVSDFMRMHGGGARLLPRALRNLEDPDLKVRVEALSLIKRFARPPVAGEAWPYTAAVFPLVLDSDDYLASEAYTLVNAALPDGARVRFALDLIDDYEAPSLRRHYIIETLGRSLPEPEFLDGLITALPPAIDVSTALLQRVPQSFALDGHQIEPYFRHAAVVATSEGWGPWPVRAGRAMRPLRGVSASTRLALLEGAIDRADAAETLFALALVDESSLRLDAPRLAFVRRTTLDWAAGEPSPMDEQRRAILSAAVRADRRVALQLIERRLQQGPDFDDYRSEEILALAIERLAPARDPFDGEVRLIASLLERGIAIEQTLAFMQKNPTAYERETERVFAFATEIEDRGVASGAFSLLIPLSRGRPAETARLLALTASESEVVREHALRAFLSVWRDGGRDDERVAAAALERADLLVAAIKTQPPAMWRRLAPESLADRMERDLIDMALARAADLNDKAWLAIESLGKSDPALTRALVVQAALADGGAAQRAIVLLARLQPRTREAFDGVALGLRRPEPSVRVLAARALREFDGFRTEAITALAPLVDDPDQAVADEVRRSLARLGWTRPSGPS